MKIHITKKEYKYLVHMLYMAEWMMSSHSMHEDPRTKPYNDLEQKLLSYAKDFGCDDLVEYAKNLEGYYPTRKLDEDETSREFISDFEENTFWQELCDRLARRDVGEQLSIEEIKEMDPLEVMQKEEEIALKYSEEFRENGIDNLIVKKK